MTPAQGSASQFLSLWMRWTLKWNPASGSGRSLLLYLSERMIITHRRPGTSQLSSKVTQAWLGGTKCLSVCILESWIQSRSLDGHAAWLRHSDCWLSIPSISQRHEREAGTGPGIGQNDLVKECTFHFQPVFPLSHLSHGCHRTSHSKLSCR